MATHLSAYLRKQRLKKGVTLGTLARQLGYQNVNKGANRIQRFEETGQAKPKHLPERLAELLEVDGPTLRQLDWRDYQQWQGWLNEKVPMRLIVRYRRDLYSEKPLPPDVTTPTQAEEFACRYARKHRRKICLVVSRRISTWIDERGEVIDRTEAQPHTTNFPFMRIGNKQCVLKIDFDEWPFEW